MRLSILAVGRSRGVLEPAVREFESRAARYWKIQFVEVDAGTGSGGRAAAARVREAEAARLQERIPSGTEVWALTRQGKLFSSPELARALGDRALHGVPGVTFLLGGAFGLDAGLLASAGLRVSFSRMTLPHAFARLILAEQLYRAGTILRGEPYHKGEG